ncbi:MAG: peptide deformylase [Desulfobulbaceae bacterium A2]|nr:MAG: peptide deformylase [Desulfobulbaceae bacterium A2]
MTIRKIFTYPDPVLRCEASPITSFDEELQRLAADMIETMYEAPGVGLAANQVGVARQLVVIDVAEDDEEHKALVLVNPEIVEAEGSVVGEEGCLSVLDFNPNVTRAQHIRVRALNLAGEAQEFEAHDRFARIIQHEVDHLRGTLIIDRVSALKRSLYKNRLKKMLKRQESHD